MHYASLLGFGNLGGLLLYVTCDAGEVCMDARCYHEQGERADGDEEE